MWGPCLLGPPADGFADGVWPMSDSEITTCNNIDNNIDNNTDNIFFVFLYNSFLEF